MSSPSSPPPPGPLAGLLVADFSRVLAGPYCTMLLADLGADVIKVEAPGGDDTRHWQPPVTTDGVSTYFLAINRNKRSVVLDLRQDGDRAAAAELARRADILVENFKPGGLAKYGLDYASVSAANPAIIYASITGFGAGQGAGLPGYDLIVQAMSGLMSLTGDADGPPYRAGVAVFDVMAGLHTAIAILAALRHRDATGDGQLVESSLLASAMSGLVNQASAVAAGGVVPHRMGNAHPSLFPYEPLPTGDGEIVIAAGNDAQFQRLCQVLGIPGVADDPRFAVNKQRTANRAELRPLLTGQLAAATSQEWFGRLTAAGIPCGPINTVDGGIALARDLGLEPVVTAGKGTSGMPTIRHPVTFSASPPSYRLPPPVLDQHGAEIRAWLAAPSSPARQEGSPAGRAAEADNSKPREGAPAVGGAGQATGDWAGPAAVDGAGRAAADGARAAADGAGGAGPAAPEAPAGTLATGPADSGSG
ncbi:MAG TPA: CoA transferase [Streptosporangiaceae bacterium]|nr:CoA transferase [Streptosporangiaceae bacterium]